MLIRTCSGSSWAGTGDKLQRTIRQHQREKKPRREWGGPPFEGSKATEPGRRTQYPHPAKKDCKNKARRLRGARFDNNGYKTSTLKKGKLKTPGMGGNHNLSENGKISAAVRRHQVKSEKRGARRRPWKIPRIEQRKLTDLCAHLASRKGAGHSRNNNKNYHFLKGVSLLRGRTWLDRLLKSQQKKLSGRDQGSEKPTSRLSKMTLKRGCLSLLKGEGPTSAAGPHSLRKCKHHLRTGAQSRQTKWVKRALRGLGSSRMPPPEKSKVNRGGGVCKDPIGLILS